MTGANASLTWSKAGRSLLVLAAGCGVAAAVFLGVNALRSRPAAVVSVDAGRMAGSRLFYPAASLPVLTLPNGRTETIHSVLNVRKRLRYGESVWDDKDVPPGPVWIRVDLTHQLLSVFRGGHEIGTAVVLYGAADKESPAGTFTILQKAERYHSRTYDAAMPFMLRLTADGVAIHGSEVQRGAATHGCIGVPTEFARRLFAQARLGDTVVVLKPAA